MRSYLKIQLAFLLPFILWLLTLAACQNADKELACNNPALTVKQNKLYNGPAIFTGNVFGLYTANDTLCKYHYSQGVMNGTQVVWHKNKKIAQQAYYKNGVLDSVQTAWWENGRKRYQMHYRMGLLNGACEYWYSSGMKKSDNYYLMGKEEGVQSYWGKDGRPHEIRIVKNGKITRKELFKNCVYVSL